MLENENLKAHYMIEKGPQKLKVIKRERSQKTSARKGQTITSRKRY